MDNRLNNFLDALVSPCELFMKLGPGLSFSWKRALGVTKAKRRVSKKTGIPMSRGGRRVKLGKWMGMK